MTDREYQGFPFTKAFARKAVEVCKAAGELREMAGDEYDGEEIAVTCTVVRIGDKFENPITVRCTPELVHYAYRSESL
jgi:hypothetical protein